MVKVNPVYLGLGAACVLMLVAIAWLVFVRKDSTGATVAQATAKGFSIPPSLNQQIRGEVEPYFKDMVEKERSDKLVAGLLAAYKTVDVAPVVK